MRRFSASERPAAGHRAGRCRTSPSQGSRSKGSTHEPKHKTYVVSARVSIRGRRGEGTVRRGPDVARSARRPQVEILAEKPYIFRLISRLHAIRTARSPKMAHAPGRGMAPFCSHRTIPGCTDAYRRCSARSDPRLMRGAPPRPTAACARRPVRHPARSRLDLRREFDKTRPSSSTHTPSASHTTQKTHSADRTRSASG